MIAPGGRRVPPTVVRNRIRISQFPHKGWIDRSLQAVARNVPRMTAVSPGWTFLSNHGHVLVSLARDPGVRMRDVAEWVGITERAVQMIVSDLERAGYVVRHRVGRRNRYTVVKREHFRHPLEEHVRIGDFLALVGDGAAPPAPAGATGAGADRA